MSTQGSGAPANHQTGSGMSGQQPALTNNLPSSVNSVGGQPTNSLSFNSETQVPLQLEIKVSDHATGLGQEKAVRAGQGS